MIVEPQINVFLTHQGEKISEVGFLILLFGKDTTWVLIGSCAVWTSRIRNARGHTDYF